MKAHRPVRRAIASPFASCLASLLTILLATAPTPTMAIQEPAYRVVRTIEEVEVRDYPPYTVAEVEVDGPAGDAGSQAFPVLFGYISGKNAGEQRLTMTAPVVQTAADPTVPVIQSAVRSPANRDRGPVRAAERHHARCCACTGRPAGPPARRSCEALRGDPLRGILVRCQLRRAPRASRDRCRVERPSRRRRARLRPATIRRSSRGSCVVTRSGCRSLRLEGASARSCPFGQRPVDTGGRCPGRFNASAMRRGKRRWPRSASRADRTSRSGGPAISRRP